MLSLSCAGDLQEPDRFGSVLNPSGGGSNSTSGSGGRAGTSSNAGASGDARAGGSGGGTASDSTTAPACVTTLFKAKCGTTIACHASGSSPQVDLVSAGMEARLVGKNSSDKLSCAGRVLVSDSGGPSLLVEKISDDPPCGAQMPLGGTLNDTESKCVSDWVGSIK